MEIASCLDFLWKKQAKKELQDMSEMRRHTDQLGRMEYRYPLNIYYIALLYYLLSSEPAPPPRGGVLPEGGERGGGPVRREAR